MQVVILKMLSGEEVIARKNEDKYEKARVVHVVQGPDGQPQATLAPYVTLAPDSLLPINKDLVIAEIVAPEQVEKSYLKATSSIFLGK